MDETNVDVTGTGDTSPVIDQTDTTTVVDQTGTTDVTQDGTTEPQSDLEAYLADQLKDAPDEAAAATTVETTPVVPQEFEKSLAISDYVKSPEHVEAAVRAADEVWKVVEGKAHVASLLEGMRAGNEKGFEKIVGDLIPYIEQVTGQKFGAGEAAQVDPVAQLRAEMTAKEQAIQSKQENFQYQQTVHKVIPVMREAIADSLGKTFGTGHDEHFISAISRASKVSEREMVDALNRGDRSHLDAAIKQVKTDEMKRFAAYSQHITKQAKDFRKSIPAAKGNGAVATNGTSSSKYDITTREGRMAHSVAVLKGEIDL